MILHKLVIKLDPLVPVHRPEAHRDVILGAVAKGAVGQWLRILQGPGRIRRRCGTGEGLRGPYWEVLVVEKERKET